MKIFVVGLPNSGRTTVAKAITEKIGGQYIDAMEWLKRSFRDRKHQEAQPQYEEAYQQFLSVRREINPNVIISNVRDLLTAYSGYNAVIDGIASPKDFTDLFDYRHDIVIFLNRTDNPVEYRDHENIGVSVMRDYCFWLSSAGLLRKERWLEYNFQIPGEPSEQVKTLGSKNSVFIIKSINQVIVHVLEKINDQIGK
jgi:hypothetical protein